MTISDAELRKIASQPDYEQLLLMRMEQIYNINRFELSTPLTTAPSVPTTTNKYKNYSKIYRLYDTDIPNLRPDHYFPNLISSYGETFYNPTLVHNFYPVASTDKAPVPNPKIEIYLKLENRGYYVKLPNRMFNVNLADVKSSQFVSLKELTLKKIGKTPAETKSSMTLDLKFGFSKLSDLFAKSRAQVFIFDNDTNQIVPLLANVQSTNVDSPDNVYNLTTPPADLTEGGGEVFRNISYFDLIFPSINNPAVAGASRSASIRSSVSGPGAPIILSIANGIVDVETDKGLAGANRPEIRKAAEKSNDISFKKPMVLKMFYVMHNITMNNFESEKVLQSANLNLINELSVFYRGGVESIFGSKEDLMQQNIIELFDSSLTTNIQRYKNGIQSLQTQIINHCKDNPTDKDSDTITHLKTQLKTAKDSLDELYRNAGKNFIQNLFKEVDLYRVYIPLLDRGKLYDGDKDELPPNTRFSVDKAPTGPAATTVSDQINKATADGDINQTAPTSDSYVTYFYLGDLLDKICTQGSGSNVTFALPCYRFVIDTDKPASGAAGSLAYQKIFFPNLADVPISFRCFLAEVNEKIKTLENSKITVDLFINLVLEKVISQNFVKFKYKNSNTFSTRNPNLILRKFNYFLPSDLPSTRLGQLGDVHNFAMSKDPPNSLEEFKEISKKVSDYKKNNNFENAFNVFYYDVSRPLMDSNNYIEKIYANQADTDYGKYLFVKGKDPFFDSSAGDAASFDAEAQSLNSRSSAARYFKNLGQDLQNCVFMQMNFGLPAFYLDPVGNPNGLSTVVKKVSLTKHEDPNYQTSQIISNGSSGGLFRHRIKGTIDLTLPAGLFLEVGSNIYLIDKNNYNEKIRLFFTNYQDYNFMGYEGIYNIVEVELNIQNLDAAGDSSIAVGNTKLTVIQQSFGDGTGMGDAREDSPALNNDCLGAATETATAEPARASSAPLPAAWRPSTFWEKFWEMAPGSAGSRRGN